MKKSYKYTHLDVSTSHPVASEKSDLEKKIQRSRNQSPDPQQKDNNGKF